MKPERCRAGTAPRWRAALVTLLLAGVACAAGGCRFLADEFTWLDRRAPAARTVPDAPVSGLAERP